MYIYSYMYLVGVFVRNWKLNESRNERLKRDPTSKSHWKVHIFPFSSDKIRLQHLFAIVTLLEKAFPVQKYLSLSIPYSNHPYIHIHRRWWLLTSILYLTHLRIGPTARNFYTHVFYTVCISRSLSLSILLYIYARDSKGTECGLRSLSSHLLYFLIKFTISILRNGPPIKRSNAAVHFYAKESFWPQSSLVV